MGADECSVNKPFSTARYTYIATEYILAVVFNVAGKFFIKYCLKNHVYFLANHAKKVHRN